MLHVPTCYPFLQFVAHAHNTGCVDVLSGLDDELLVFSGIYDGVSVTYNMWPNGFILSRTEGQKDIIIMTGNKNSHTK